MTTAQIVWLCGAVIAAPISAGIAARMFWRDQGELLPPDVLLIAFIFVLGGMLWPVTSGLALLYFAFRAFANAAKPREVKAAELRRDTDRLERDLDWEANRWSD